jgi:hypothetical protein
MAPDDVQPEVEPPVIRTWAIPVFTAKPADASLLAVGRRVGDLLAKPDALPFSASALEELKARFESHALELVNESGRIARRQQADVISPAYIRQASDRLVVRKGQRRVGLAGSIGGVLGGVALPTLLDVAAGKPMSPIQVVGSAVLGMLGVLLIAVQFFRE